MNVIGLDLGGANLKMSDGQTACSRPFALWRSPERLSGELSQMLSTAPADACLAVTMTGELADCFETRRAGVAWILDAVEQAAGQRPVFVWQTGGEFVSLDDARLIPELVAAANWHGLATWAARVHPEGNVLLIDIGSTTTDIIPIERGLPMPSGRTDLERLASGELLYLGVRRTPLCGIVEEMSLRGQQIGLARELFATTLDIGLLCGTIPEAADDFETANGRPATRRAAADRLARMLCSDRDDLTAEEIASLASQMLQHLDVRVAAAIRSVVGRWNRVPEYLLLSGEGSWLAERALGELDGWEAIPKTDLTGIFGPQIAQAACAYALSHLCREWHAEGGGLWPLDFPAGSIETVTGFQALKGP